MKGGISSEQIVLQREFENLRLESEHVAEFRYRPGKCEREYRVVVLRMPVDNLVSNWAYMVTAAPGNRKQPRSSLISELEYHTAQKT